MSVALWKETLNALFAAVSPEKWKVPGTYLVLNTCTLGEG